MDINAKDCRLEGFAGGRSPRFNKGTHLPTGTVVEFANLLTKREVMKALQGAVNEFAHRRRSGFDCNNTEPYSSITKEPM